MKIKHSAIPEGTRLAKNVSWNFIGIGAPLLVALVAIPILIDEIGTDRFGVLSIIWMVIGYFSLFDLGLGRALTKLVAEKIGTEAEAGVPDLVWTATSIMAALGVIGAITLFAVSSWLVEDALNVPVALQSEVTNAFQLLAISIPFVITTTAFRGVLEAYQHFGWINIVRIPLGVLTFLGPLAVVPFAINLEPIVIVLLSGRLISWVVHILLCIKILPVLKTGKPFTAHLVPALLKFGGWMTVTNVIGPLMVYLDRFLIGAVLSMTAVAYYATPYEMITKLWLIPGVLLPVLFPAFSTAIRQRPAQAVQLFSQGLNFVFIILFPIILIIYTLSYEALAIWLDTEFASHSTAVLQWLAIGVFINSLAQVSLALVQGAGKPDWTAKIHLLELPFYLAGLWWLLATDGIIGAAIVWTVRIIIDALLLFAMVIRLLPESRHSIKRILLFAAVALLILQAGGLVVAISMKLIFICLALLVFGLAAWFYMLAEGEKQLIHRIINRK